MTESRQVVRGGFSETFENLVKSLLAVPQEMTTFALG